MKGSSSTIHRSRLLFGKDRCTLLKDLLLIIHHSTNLVGQRIPPTMDRIPDYGFDAPERGEDPSNTPTGANDSKRISSCDILNTRDHLLFAWPKDVVYQDDLREHRRRRSTDSESSSYNSSVESTPETGAHSDMASGAVRH